ncbi:DUF2934 domain-containing protein [Ancylobacter radicis]|uniref:DUF2934 domain-containing protein n=1 Tax=Ancylobacter radicis TaxID=2836179 RepID=A0ABS5RB68_9HYPH|nr:DUF2934 domain-containing protein [Ancylobacter radicis]MBS9478909.1 DUF2934 domain-containing protein [Ancylobacter radicis]
MNEREQRIRHQAYLLWERDGRPDGRDLDYWHRAERSLDEASRDEVDDGPAGDDGEMSPPARDRGESFSPVDAAAAPAAPTASPMLDGAPVANADIPVEPDRALPGAHTPADVDPNVRMQGGEVEPVSEIASIRRTLEVPPSRRGAASPMADTAGAFSGNAGARRRPGTKG